MMKTCLYPECQRGAQGRGLCAMHLLAYRRRVEAGKTTWHELEAAGLVMPTQSMFTVSCRWMYGDSIPRHLRGRIVPIIPKPEAVKHAKYLLSQQLPPDAVAKLVRRQFRLNAKACERVMNEARRHAG